MRRILALTLPFFLLSPCLAQVNTSMISNQTGALVANTTKSGDQMMSARYKRLSRLSLAMWVSGNSVKPERVFAQNYVNHQIPSIKGGVAAENLNEWEALVADYHKSFSNSKVRILTQIYENNLVATRWQLTATQTGTYMGLAPTGKRVSWSGIEIDRFDQNNKIAESWVAWDMYDMFSQLGLINQSTVGKFKHFSKD